MKNKPLLTVVKIGGNIIDDVTLLDRFLADFAALKGFKILVHGGGKMATRTAESLGLVTVFHEGRRITDAPMLEVAVMTYAGWINKSITAKLQASGNNAMGVAGTDGNLVRSEKRKSGGDIDYGFVGDIRDVNVTLLEALLLQGIVPVFSPITHDGSGQLLNTNGDTVAGLVASGMSIAFDVTLLYCFEKKGVLANVDDDESVIPEITLDTYRKLKSEGAIHSGMLPKLENCFQAISRGVSLVGIGNSGMLKKEITCYTLITP